MQHPGTGSPFPGVWFEKQIAMKRFFLLLFLGACPAMSAQVRFSDYFLEETMRFDYYHSGDSRSEEYFFDALKAEPYWAGSHVSLLDTTGYGNQFFRIVDRASEREIYSRGFCTLFNEWQSTAEADSVRRSYPESVVFPYPRRPCRIEIFGRNAGGHFEKRFSQNIDPASCFVAQFTPRYETFEVAYNGNPAHRVDIVLLPEGYNIRDTERNLRTMEEWLHAQPEVKTVSVTMGSTPPRYYLASSSVSLRPNFGNILVELHDKGQTEAVEARFNAYVRAMCPDVWLRSSLFKLSPVPDAAIEFGFIGDDIDTLRRLTQAAEEIMWRTAGTVNIRNSWGNRVPTWLPLYSQMKGQRIGVTRSQMAQGITIATQGYRLGEYREGDQFMPILLKDENIDTYNLTNLQALPIFTPAGKVYSIEQATDGFRFEYRVGVVKRYNRQRVMKAQCDPGRGVNTMRLYAALRDSVLRGVVLPEGYSMKVFGEQESQQESNSALARYMPLTMVLIFIVLLLLFRNYREPTVILLMIPLIFIGVVLGLAVTGKVFNFFSLLGLLGLVGMNIKNAVVLVEQIGVLRSEGKGAYEALTAATRSRIVPVAMASGTTILGMLPLLFDSMFGAMAATIMGGLLVATLLTVCVLPVVYAIFYNIRKS